ncbi:MAG: HAD family phosphatase [Rikenellaceae bacterium]
MLKNIECIVFDIGGVLVDLNLERCISQFKTLGFADAERLVSCYHPADFFGALERGELSVGEFCDKIREVSGLDSLSDDSICCAYCSLLESIPRQKLQMLESLRGRGFRLFALSNINPVMISMIRGFFEADGRSADFYFEEMFLSFEMGVMKPSREIYERVVAATGVEPSRILFVDDGVKNVEAARELGFQVYLASAKEDFSHIFE